MTIPLCAVLGLFFLASERFLAWRRRGSNLANAKSADAGTLPLLWVVIASSIGAGLMIALWGVGPRLPRGFPWGAASVGVFALGAALRWWAVVHLGRFFTVDVTVAADHRVIDTGPYRVMRHPSYTGVLMQFAGWALSLGNVLALPVVVVPILLGLLYRIRVEEAALRGALGEEYSTYCRRTKRLVPGVY